MRKLLVGLVAVVLVAGCGGDDDAAEPTAEALEATALEYAEAFLDADVGGTYDRLSERCRDEVGRAEWGAQLQVGLSLVAGFADVDVEDIEVVGVESRAVTATSGEVLTNLEVDGDPLGTNASYDPWVFEDGWRSDECDIAS